MTTWGTSHFVSLGCAVTYYRDYGLTRSDVERRVAEGEIHIGKPALKDGEALSVIDDGRRYAIITGDSSRSGRKHECWRIHPGTPNCALGHDKGGAQ